MAAYRQSAAPRPPASRFVRTLSLWLTRARLAPDRAEVDTPDPVPCTYAWLGLLGFTVYAWPCVLHPAGAALVLLLLSVALTARVELRVYVGQAVLRRRLLGLTWRETETTACGEHDWLELGIDSDDLVFPGPPAVCVLTTSILGIREEEIAEIAGHARALVASGRPA